MKLAQSSQLLAMCVPPITVVCSSKLVNQCQCVAMKPRLPFLFRVPCCLRLPWLPGVWLQRFLMFFVFVHLGVCQVFGFLSWGLSPAFLMNFWGLKRKLRRDKDILLLGKAPILNLWAATSLGVAYQIFCISDIYITINNSKITVMK